VGRAVVGSGELSRRYPKSRESAMSGAVLALTLTLALPTAPLRAEARDSIVRTIVDAPRTPGPQLVLVSIRKQRIRIFDDVGEVTSSRISSGQPGFDTPTGVFSILEKKVHHQSNIYNGAEMPFMQRITWSGIAMHAGNVPGYRASHGCIRLPYSFAKSLFGLTRTGARVVVTQDEITPVVFDHPKLFKPLPANAPKTISRLGTGDTRVASNDPSDDAGLELPRFFGITPALADAVSETVALPPARPTSRAQADRAMTDRLVNLQAALKTAEAQKNSAAEKAKTVLRDTEAAVARMEAGRQTVNAVRANVRAAEAKQVQAIAAYTAFMKNAAVPSLTAAARDEQEADLEDAILDATFDADKARDAAARGEMSFAEVQTTSAAGEAARLAAIDTAKNTEAQVKSISTALIEAKKKAERYGKPISVFVSLKAQRITIRQGFEPLLEAPITVDTTKGRIGTHVMTAMKYGADPDRFMWHLVSAQTPAAGEPETSSKKNKRRDAVQIPQSASAGVRLAAAALDAVKIPQEILDTIAELARPGSSLIISDRELPANENGLGTEFVVLTR
jgi:L,D-transpeptidase catalytic domain